MIYRFVLDFHQYCHKFVMVVVTALVQIVVIVQMGFMELIAKSKHVLDSLLYNLKFVVVMELVLAQINALVMKDIPEINANIRYVMERHYPNQEVLFVEIEGNV